MRSIPPDPFESLSVVEFGRSLRSGEITVEATTRKLLRRIEVLNPRLNAFVQITDEAAVRTARGIDHLVGGRTDLGALMGVPVAVKDLLVVDGMSTRVGSEMPVGDFLDREGPFVTVLKRMGCIILGKTRMTEFAAGAQNIRHPTPWNPWDASSHRTPGGSSSGSAVAKAAGLCGFAVGTDTGGSIRLPAAMCGAFGLKTSTGLWSCEGVFPLCPSMDTIGVITNTAADAACIFNTLTGKDVSVSSLQGLRLGIPKNYYFDEMDPTVERCTERAISELGKAGVRFENMEFPEVEESNEIFAKMVPSDLLATLGRERFLQWQDAFDPVVKERLSLSLDLSAIDYVRLLRRQRELVQIGDQRLKGLDGWVSPTTPILPQEIASFGDTEEVVRFNSKSLRNTRPGNMYGYCASTIPIQEYGSSLPVGLQIHCAHGCDAKLLSISMAIERVIGKSTTPDLSSFMKSKTHESDRPSV